MGLIFKNTCKHCTCYMCIRFSYYITKLINQNKYKDPEIRIISCLKNLSVYLGPFSGIKLPDANQIGGEVITRIHGLPAFLGLSSLLAFISARDQSAVTVFCRTRRHQIRHHK